MKWTVRTRLVGLSALGITLLTAVGATGWWSLRQASLARVALQAGAQLARHHHEADRMRDAIRADLLAHLAARTPAQRAEAAQDLSAHVARLERHSEALALAGLPATAAALDPETRALLDRLRAEHGRYARLAVAAARLAEQGDAAGAERTLVDLQVLGRELAPAAERVSDRLEAAGTGAAGGMDRATGAGTSLMLFISGFAILALLFAARAARRAILGPLDESVRVMDAIAGGDLDARVHASRDDELGRLALAVNRAVESLGDALARIADNAVAVGNAAEELASVSSELQSSARQTSEQMALASGAGEETNTSVRLVASSAQQVGAGIRSVAQHAHEAAGVAATAVRVAGEANATIRQLGESSEQIDTVIRAINAIAEQTNILALNAEIEAARAGDAGKGFAVVANEVKELAKETARATEDIGRRVSAIRGDGLAAVSAISEIGGIIAQISSSQSAIAASVQQQSAATAEITRNMGEAARGTDEIAATVNSVARATESTSAAAIETQRAASELAMMAVELQRTVAQFHFRARARGAGERAARMSRSFREAPADADRAGGPDTRAA
jgi:methyl-accepting chemotaxis protein